MNKEKITAVFSQICEDISSGKKVRIIGAMSSTNKWPYYFRFRNMVSKDLCAGVCYAGFSKKDFKKLYKYLEKFEGKTYTINREFFLDSNELKQNVLIEPAFFIHHN